MLPDLLMMAIGLAFAGVGVVSLRGTTAAAARRQALANEAFDTALKATGTLGPGGDFVATLAPDTRARVHLLRPRATAGRRLRWAPSVLAGHQGLVSLAVGTDGVIAEVTLDGIALLRQVPIRIGPPSTVGAGADDGRRRSTGDRAFDAAYRFFADDADAVKHIARETDILEAARAIFTTGGLSIDGAGGTLRVVATLPLHVDAVARFAVAVLTFAACLDVDVSRFHGLGAIGAIGGSSGSPFALPSA